MNCTALGHQLDSRWAPIGHDVTQMGQQVDINRKAGGHQLYRRWTSIVQLVDMNWTVGGLQLDCR